MKLKTYYLHVNKHTQRWTLHGSGVCIPAEKVLIRVPCETVHKPDKKDNPRFFIKLRGYLRELSPGVFEISEVPHEIN